MWGLQVPSPCAWHRSSAGWNTPQVPGPEVGRDRPRPRGPSWELYEVCRCEELRSLLLEKLREEQESWSLGREGEGRKVELEANRCGDTRGSF